MIAQQERDLVALVIWYALAFGTLGLAEWLRRHGWAPHETRKLIHVTAGTSVFFILLSFDHPTIGLIPFASFIILNYWFHRRGAFGSMDAAGPSFGTVYFAISITILLTWLWREGPTDRSPLAAAAIAMMTYGDAAAATLGRAWGRHHYRFLGSQRSLEGSAAMFVVSTVAATLTLILYGDFSLGVALPISMATAVVASVAEATSPHGLDNLTVPLLAAASLVLLAEV